jgi:cytochrome d ubiquinol oxidase subunit II
VELAWYLLLGLTFATYLVLGGVDYGVGVLYARPATEAGRRVALNTVGPFLLGNEVWLVAAAGLLLGAFPALEGALLSGLYPAVAAGLTGSLLTVTAVMLRSRPTGRAGRTAWDRLITVGAVLAPAGWGAVLGGLLQGVAPRGAGHGLTAFTAACALATVALAAVHGAAFLTLRLPPESARRHAGLVTRLVPVALAAVGAATVVGLLSSRVRAAVARPVPAALLLGLLVAALLAARFTAARFAAGRGRPGWALAGTGAALALPVLLVGAATYPVALVSTTGGGLAVADAAAGDATLRLLAVVLLPLLPLLYAAQAAGWWAFRRRTDRDAPAFF